MRLDMRADIAAGSSQGEGTLTRSKGAVIWAITCEVDRQLAEYPSQPERIVEGFRQHGGFLEVLQPTLNGCSKGRPRTTQVEQQVDSLLARVPRLRELPQGRQRLLEGRQRLPIRRVPHGLVPRLTTV